MKMLSKDVANWRLVFLSLPSDVWTPFANLRSSSKSGSFLVLQYWVTEGHRTIGRFADFPFQKARWSANAFCL